jgi:hypothetical protein
MVEVGWATVKQGERGEKLAHLGPPVDHWDVVGKLRVGKLGRRN